jgi:hypothetical protein
MIKLLEPYLKFTKAGYINTGLPWYSPSDLANFIGKSRQYWCKLIKQGKLKAHQTSCGPIVTTEQLIEYYKNK